METKEKLLQLNIRSTLFELEGLMSSYSKMSNGRMSADILVKNNARNLIKHYCCMISEWTDVLQEFSSLDGVKLSIDKFIDN